MATLEDSPSLYQGQPWSQWAERVGLREENDGEEEDEESNSKQEGDSMKLSKEDMSLFGFCPARDDFYLVVCEICGHVVKPQALKSHIDLRHGGSMHKLDRSERQSKQILSQELPSSLSSLNKQKSGSNVTTPSPKYSTGSASKSSHSKHETKSKKNHSMAPVVRVERMPTSIMMKKSTPNNLPLNSSTNAVPVDKREIPSPQQPPPLPPPQPPLSSNKKNTPSEGKTKSSSSSSKSKVQKERKLLPCKDRVYDPNKHCGVCVADTGKQCTRSLTCKTHSLAMRRSVPGRKKNFDELLADHRAAKEALLKATKEAAQISANSSSSHSSGNSASKTSSGGKSGNSSAATPKPSSAKSKPASSRGSAAATSKASSQLNNSTASSAKDISQADPHSSETGDDKSGISKSSTNVDPGYLLHHPRPAAACLFNARQMGVGFYVFDRRLDHIRSVLRTSLVDRGSHPPPSKKLCVESKLPPVPDFSDPSDPYSFSWVDQNSSGHTPISTATVGTLTTLTVTNSTSTTTVATNLVSTCTTVTSSSGPLSVKPVTSKTKSKPLNHKSNKEIGSNSGTVNRTNSSTSSASSGNSAKRKRTNVNNVSTNAGLSTVTTTTAVPLVTSTIVRNAHIVTRTPANTHMESSKTNPKNAASPAVTAMQTVKNHNFSTNAANNAYRDLNIVVTSLDVMNGQLPANASTVLGRNFQGVHTLNSIASSGIGLGTGVNIATKNAATVHHLERMNTKKSKTSSNKGAKNASLESRQNVMSPYLSGIITSTGILVDGGLPAAGLHSTVTLPAVVNSSSHIQLAAAMRNSNMSPPPQPSPSTTPSPLFRSGSVSPQVPTSSPLANGLGLSPPSTSTIQTKLANHMLSGTSPVISPSGLVGASSPELTSPGSQSKGKGNLPRHNANTTKSVSTKSSSSSSSYLSGTSAQLALSRAATVPPRTSKSAMGVSGITFQQVYASQVLEGAHLSQSQLPSKSSVRNLPIATSPPLTVPLLTTSAVSSGTSPSQQVRPPVLLQPDDLRHQEYPGSPSLPT